MERQDPDKAMVAVNDLAATSPVAAAEVTKGILTKLGGSVSTAVALSAMPVMHQAKCHTEVAKVRHVTCCGHALLS